MVQLFKFLQPHKLKCLANGIAFRRKLPALSETTGRARTNSYFLACGEIKCAEGRLRATNPTAQEMARKIFFKK